MSIPTIGVVVFPGSNCDRDAEAAWTELGFGNVNALAFAVPVPAVVWLFPSGLIAGLAWMRRRNST